ncbi:MAG: DUF1850 domain-containing protein [Spirochaetaceae bacterium]|nr:MAG: DUF1850 domain-containing protein [Spirochaetaceae bacterium]
MSNRGVPGVRAGVWVLAAIAALLLPSALPAAAGRNASWTLVVSAPHQDAVRYRAAVSPGDVFSLTYVHSVSRSEVSGSFRVTADALIEPVDTVFRSFGPGLPWTPDADYRRLDDGSMLVRHHEPARSEIRVWVSPLTRDRLTVNGTEIDLSAESERATLIEIMIQKQGVAHP